MPETIARPERHIGAQILMAQPTGRPEPVIPPAASPIKPECDTTDLDREALYNEFAPLISRLIRQYGWSAELREDMVGEIYFRFNALLDVFDPTRGVPLKAYLVRQLSVGVFTYARQHRRVHAREMEWDIAMTEDILADCVVDPTGEWNDRLVLADLRKRLPEAIDKLPQRQGIVLSRRYFEERPYPDIAKELNVEQATVRSLLRHAINNLRRLLRESSPEVAY
jgi:RNA polymerase sigma factor (sigma-70 family)